MEVHAYLRSGAFTPVRGKKPYKDDWPNNPFDSGAIEEHLKQHPTEGFGMLSGIHKLTQERAYCFVDFDGPWSFQFFVDQIGIDTLNEVVDSDAPTWTSGRDGRFQIMFSVPQQHWAHLLSKSWKDPNPPHGQKADGFELRWSRKQSVMPPSTHEDTGKPYSWLTEPTATNIKAAIPSGLLNWWLEQSRPPEPTAPREDFPASESEVRDILTEFKRYYPSLDYALWQKTTAAVMKELGKSPGIAVMKEFYPEQQRGEYERCFGKWHSYEVGQSTSLGTMVALIRRCDPDYVKGGGISEEELAEVLAAKRQRASEKATEAPDAEWAPPISVPITLLPTAMREAMDAFRVKSNVPYEASIQCVLAVAAFAAQGIANVETGGIDGVKPLSEYFINLLKSGCAKSALFAPLVEPIEEFQALQREDYDLRLRLYQKKVKLYEQTLDEVAEGKVSMADHELKNLEPVEPMGDTFLVQRPTYNSVVDTIRNVPVCGLFTPEGTEFIYGWGFQDPNRAVEAGTMLTKLWTAEGISSETKERKIYIGRSKRFSLLLLIQPELAGALLNNPRFKSQGLEARFLISQPERFTFPDVDLSPEGRAKTEHQNTRMQPFRDRIAAMIRQAVNTDEKNKLVLTFDDAAAKTLQDWTNAHKNLRQSTLFKHMIEFASRLMEHATRLAGILCCFEGLEVINQQHVETATQLMDFYIGQRLTLDVAVAVDRKDEYLALIPRVEQWLEQQPTGKAWELRDFTKGPRCVRNISNDWRHKILDELVSQGKLDLVEVRGKTSKPIKRWIKN